MATKESDMKTAIGKRTIFAAGLALALPFGLAACGGADKPSKDEVLDGMSTMLDEQFAAMGASKEQLEQIGITDEMFGEYYSCIVDDIYDEVDNDTLQKIAAGDAEARVPSDDEAVLESASMDCLDILGL